MAGDQDPTTSMVRTSLGICYAKAGTDIGYGFGICLTDIGYGATEFAGYGATLCAVLAYGMYGTDAGYGATSSTWCGTSLSWVAPLHTGGWYSLSPRP
eukprot:3828269-Rhodomonas_salina.1